MVETVFQGFYTVDIFDCPPFDMFTVGDDPRAQSILESKTFEPHSMRIWCYLVRAATCVVDIGAHTGVYALAAAALRKDVPVHAFEPNPYSTARLRVHRQINGFANLTDYAVALSDVTGITEIGWSEKKGDTLPSGSQFANFDSAYYAYRAAVHTYPLDSFGLIVGPRPLVKIDVEGAELQVLKGMARFLKARPAIILESFNPVACDQITAMLAGYRFALIEESGALKMRDELIACDRKGNDFNQLCIPEWVDLKALDLSVPRPDIASK